DDDSDGDGSCDSDDLCPGFDDADDLDLDQVPDGCDPDRDGDTILDEHEGQCLVDTDQDLLVDCEDLDSDEDGIPDATEAGDGDPLTEPVDTDADHAPDFVDTDADDDGLLDEHEAGCPGSTERTLSDSDADTYSDLV
ncbi:MAG: VWA domain-containing protein, partial [Deltaproteobacteria bacterium]|nr:VWA domain-containing protein [Deltaproteobacteria bacterium]